METGSISSSGPLSQQMLLEAAQLKMLKKNVDQQGKAALQLIESATTAKPTAGVGGLLNITA